MNWLQTTIGHVCLPTTQRDPALSGDETFRYVDIAGIDRETKTILRADSIMSSEAPSRARRVIKSGDVLVSTVRPNLNAVAQVPDDLDDAIASTGFAVLRPKPNVVRSRYLFYWVQHREFVTFLSANATGASYPAVSDGVVRRAALPLPPLLEQSRIVELLDEANRVRKLRRDANAQIARILLALFLKMFGDPATNPRGWPQGSLASFGNSVRYGLGQPPKAKDSGMPVIRATNVHAGVIDRKNMIYADPEDVPRSRNPFLVSNEVIVVRSGAYTGDVAQVTEEWQGAVAGYDLIVSPAPNWTGEFLEQYLLTPFIQEHYFASQKSRAGQPHLNATQLEATPIFCPPVDSQGIFANYVREIRRIRSNAISSTDRINEVLSTLISRAFSGQLTASWREGHAGQLLSEIDRQAKLLNLPGPNSKRVAANG